MSEKANHLYPFPTESSQSIFERTFFAEYLMCKGYLVSDLAQLSPEVARSLMREARLFVRIGLMDIESSITHPWETRFAISLN